MFKRVFTSFKLQIRWGIFLQINEIKTTNSYVNIEGFQSMLLIFAKTMNIKCSVLI
jgi:hypothetical protein